MRIAVLATAHGEQVVLRILGTAGDRPTIAKLGMEESAREAFVTAIEQPYGTVIVCGPTGSGKTTTLYGAVDHLNRSDRVVITIEDPIEYRIDGINQIEVDPKGGLTFASGLRTILRSDPDVLLVGEIRDHETASIAIQAAQTGHLVLTSLHAHNAASAVARLRDMGVDPGLLAGSLNAVVAQRLARRLCVHCREPYGTSAEIAGIESETISGAVTLFRAVGCAKCQGTGFMGRVALREVMPVQGEVRALVERSADEIFAAAVRQGMTTMRDDGMRLALAGISSVEEIRRVTGLRLI
jgi:type IV pilus assembly protein PilB